MELRPVGLEAVLVELGADDPTPARLAEVVRESVGGGVLVEVVPAARTLLVVARDVEARQSVARALPRLVAQAAAESGGLRDPAGLRGPGGQSDPAEVGPQGDPVTLRVVYDGADLDAVAQLLGRSREALVRWHAQTAWTVQFCGFAPGFGYLTADEGGVDVPRLEQPRTRVPAGAVGLAGPCCGVYPRASPGGWQLIGRTDAVLWDLDRPDPALLAPGTRVRFEPVRQA
ncbi:5-oxoprolinase subunit B family protein [Arsenicicoccus piscis]|uniref:Carboxyltransferase domain-containing protein n=1 Tax=Arsenicicoccus piscis TaxID=673954 RepID=A0ABQ6HNW4_9MICO|nr:carboxyltransferase domain-containing protein [Arsenicicoccus piscis]GMA20158.1 hypothetical protein GCM10025862_21790 [Arsenicicoccus piscis]